jgi:peptidoglycan/LPS O-acetylase OafA/YrhL
LIAAFVLLPQATVDVIKNSVRYAFLGIPNFFYYRNVSESYFEINTIHPLLHMWSLGLELQFYFVWSLILLFAHKLKINLVYLIIFLSLLSFAIAAYFYSNPAAIFLFGREFTIGKKFVFYLLPSRIWEFGIGALASIFKKDFDNVRIHHLFFTIGMMMVFIALCFLKITDEFSPFIAILPCIGTFLFMTFSSEGNIFYKILSTKFLVTIGIVSYSLYLWHFPLIEFFKYFYEPYDLVAQVMTLICIVSLAIISYKFVESYYRHIKSPLSFPKYGVCFVFLVLLSYMYNKDDLNSDFYKFTSDYPGSCLYQPDNSINNFDKKNCTLGTDLYKPNILVVGSSHTNSFVPFLSVLAQQYGFSFINITANSTGYAKEYLLGEEFKNDQARINLHATFYKLISHMESNFDILVTCPSWAEGQHQIFAKNLRRWSRKFKMVILINHVPVPDKFKLRRRIVQNKLGFKFTSDNYSDFLESEARKYDNVFHISFNNLILENNGLDDQQHALFFDSGHLNIGGAMYLAKKIIQDKTPNILKSSKFLELSKSKKMNS